MLYLTLNQGFVGSIPIEAIIMDYKAEVIKATEEDWRKNLGPSRVKSIFKEEYTIWMDDGSLIYGKTEEEVWKNAYDHLQWLIFTESRPPV